MEAWAESIASTMEDMQKDLEVTRRLEQLRAAADLQEPMQKPAELDKVMKIQAVMCTWAAHQKSQRLGPYQQLPSLDLPVAQPSPRCRSSTPPLFEPLFREGEQDGPKVAAEDRLQSLAEAEEKNGTDFSMSADDFEHYLFDDLEAKSESWDIEAMFDFDASKSGEGGSACPEVPPLPCGITMEAPMGEKQHAEWHGVLWCPQIVALAAPPVLPGDEAPSSPDGSGQSLSLASQVSVFPGAYGDGDSPLGMSMVAPPSPGGSDQSLSLASQVSVFSGANGDGDSPSGMSMVAPPSPDGPGQSLSLASQVSVFSGASRDGVSPAGMSMVAHPSPGWPGVKTTTQEIETLGFPRAASIAQLGRVGDSFQSTAALKDFCVRFWGGRFDPRKWNDLNDGSRLVITLIINTGVREELYASVFASVEDTMLRHELLLL